MKRSSPPKRRTPLRRSSLSSGQTRKRGGKIKRKAKKPSTFAYQYGSKARVAFVKALPCAINNALCGFSPFGIPRENHHITRRSGMGLKGPSTDIIPLCSLHHTRWHMMGRKRFLAAVDRTEADLTRIAAETEKLWLASSGRADSTETP